MDAEVAFLGLGGIGQHVLSGERGSGPILSQYITLGLDVRGGKDTRGVQLVQLSYVLQDPGQIALESLDFLLAKL
jgi:hypothetical protein